MRGQWRRATVLILTRLLAIGWAVWAASTAWAYADTTPEVLQNVEILLRTPIWAVWAAAAMLLLLGVMVPPSTRTWVQHTGTVLRGSGMALAAGLLFLWGAEFYTSDMERGWVSGKNYLWLGALALASSYLVGLGSERAEKRPPND